MPRSRAPQPRISLDGVLDHDVGGRRHVAARNGVVELLAQLVHALAGQVDLGAQVVGLGVDHRAKVIHRSTGLLGAVLVGVAHIVPGVVGDIGSHGAGLGARAWGQSNADNSAGSGTKKCAGDKAESLTHDHSSPAGTSVPTV